MSSRIECPQWRSSIFSRYINNQASVDDLATLHNHFNKCTLCYQRFVAPMKESMELAYQDNQANEDIPAQKASWQLFKKDLIAIAQQANAEDISFDLAYQQLVEAQSLHSQNIDYLASLASEEVAHLLDDSGGRVAVFPPAKHAYKRKQLLADVFKVAAIVILAVSPVVLVLKSTVLKPNPASVAQISIKASRYELIDQQLDRYLQARLTNNMGEAETALKVATSIAQEMSSQTKDLYGQDLVEYYRNLASEKLSHAIKARKLAKESQDIGIRNQPAKIVAKAQEAQAIFEALGADIELEALNFTLTKYLIVIGKLPEAQILVDKYHDKAKEKQHLLSYAQYLYNQSDILGEKAQYTEEIRLLNESINIAIPLDVPKFLTYVQVDLSKVYFVTNDDQNALTQAEQILSSYKDISNYRMLLDLKQVAGISSYNLKAITNSETYLTDSITIAKQHNDLAYLVQGYWMLGLVKAQEFDFKESERLFSLAFETIPKLDNSNSELYFESVVTGYYARSQALAKNHQQSVDLYAKSIALLEKLNVEQKLSLSQLHQGLAEGLLALGKSSKAREEMEIARNLGNQAQKNLEQNNNLLSFAPVSRTSIDIRLNTP